MKQFHKTYSSSPTPPSELLFLREEISYHPGIQIGDQQAKPWPANFLTFCLPSVTRSCHRHLPISSLSLPISPSVMLPQFSIHHHFLGADAPYLVSIFFNLILYWAVRECLTGGFLCAVSSLLSPLLLISPCQGREEQASCSQDGDKDMGWFYRTSSISFSIWWKGLFTTLFLYGSPFGLMTSIAPCFLGNL